MNPYLVKLVYQIHCGEGRHTAQFDEQLRLIAAADEEEALQKGQAIGLQEEETFFNNRQQLVQWKFVNVVDLFSINEAADGAEVFSQIEESDDPQAYCNFAHHKAAALRKRCASLTPQTL